MSANEIKHQRFGGGPKVHATLGAAKKNSHGLLIRVKVGMKTFYISGPIKSLDGVQLLRETKSGGYTVESQVTMYHLARLGNANHAEARPGSEGKKDFINYIEDMG